MLLGVETPVDHPRHEHVLQEVAEHLAVASESIAQNNCTASQATNKSAPKQLAVL